MLCWQICNYKNHDVKLRISRLVTYSWMWSSYQAVKFTEHETFCISRESTKSDLKASASQAKVHETVLLKAEALTLLMPVFLGCQHSV